MFLFAGFYCIEEYVVVLEHLLDGQNLIIIAEVLDCAVADLESCK